MKKLLNISPFIMLLIPVFFGVAFMLWNPDTELHAEKIKEKNSSTQTPALIGTVKTLF